MRDHTDPKDAGTGATEIGPADPAHAPRGLLRGLAAGLTLWAAVLLIVSALS